MNDKVLRFGTIRLVKVSITLFYIFGMWPKRQSTIFYTIFGYMYHALTTFGWTTAKCIGTLMLEKRNEIIMLTASSIYCVVSTYRTFIFMWKYKIIKSSLNAISSFLMSEAENEIVQHKLKTFSKTTSAYTAFIFAGLASAFLNPVLSDERVMPVPIWLPYIYWKENDRDFYIGLVFSVFGISSMVIACSITPIIVWYLMFASSLMLDVLGRRLQTIGYGYNDQTKVINDLLESIKMHKEISGNIKRIEDSLSSVFLLQIVSSAVCLCSIAYLMASESISDNFNNFTMYVALGGIYGYEIFVLIYYGNEIALASDRLSYCIYESNWIYMSSKCRKIIIIVSEKLKKPQELVVGKVFTMRIKLLTLILNVAYSILNVLRKDQQ